MQMRFLHTKLNPRQLVTQSASMDNIMRFPVDIEARRIPAEDDTTYNIFANEALPQEIQALLTPIRSRAHGLVLVIRGPVGIGKSTLAKKIYAWCRDNGLACVICSADVWFLNNVSGEYKWVGNELSHAHNHCKGRFLLAMASRANVVVVDNTNIHRAHYQWYLDHHDTQLYRSHVIEFDCEELSTASRAAGRSCHVERDYDHALRWRQYKAARHDGAIVVQPAFSILSRVAPGVRLP